MSSPTLTKALTAMSSNLADVSALRNTIAALGVQVANMEVAHKSALGALQLEATAEPATPPVQQVMTAADVEALLTKVAASIVTPAAKK